MTSTSKWQSKQSRKNGDSRVSPFKTGFYIVAGWLFVVIGGVGVVTPLLPATPFLLLASACFARGSQRFHRWLMTHPKLSRPILDWQQHGVIRKPAKYLATALIVGNSLFPLYIIQGLPLILRVGTGVALGGVLIFIWSRPSVTRPSVE